MSKPIPQLTEELREKVARAICAVEFQWPAYLDEAEDAIKVVLQALIEMELPDDVMVEAKCVPTVAGDWRANYHAEFRAILSALKPLLTREQAS